MRHIHTKALPQIYHLPPYIAARAMLTHAARRATGLPLLTSCDTLIRAALRATSRGTGVTAEATFPAAAGIVVMGQRARGGCPAGMWLMQERPPGAIVRAWCPNRSEEDVLWVRVAAAAA